MYTAVMRNGGEFIEEIHDYDHDCVVPYQGGIFKGMGGYVYLC